MVAKYLFHYIILLYNYFCLTPTTTGTEIISPYTNMQNTAHSIYVYCTRWLKSCQLNHPYQHTQHHYTWKNNTTIQHGATRKGFNKYINEANNKYLNNYIAFNCVSPVLFLVLFIHIYTLTTLAYICVKKM